MIDQIIHSHEFAITVRLLLAIICGGMLGLERERKRMPAGFRTYMLVCVSAALVMITNEYLMTLYPGIDPTRMGAQVISGIGFLGVGTIIVTGDKRVKGLTTAAGLWATASVGLAIGAGYYYAAIFVSVIIYILMSSLQPLDRVVGKTARNINVYIEFEDISDVGKFIKEIRNQQIKVYDMEIKTSNKSVEMNTTVFFSLSLPVKEKHQFVMERLNTMEGVIFAQEI